MIFWRSLWTSIIVLYLVSFSGCWSGPQAYEVVVSVDSDSWAGGTPTMEVDLVAVTDIELKRDGWDSLSVSKYFQPRTQENNVRAQFYSAEKMRRLYFGQGRPPIQTVSEDDPFWEKRLTAGARNLVIIADLPGSKWTDSPGEDPRRVNLPLDCSRWDTDIIKVQLTRLSLDVLTPMTDVD